MHAKLYYINNYCQSLEIMAKSSNVWPTYKEDLEPVW